MRVNGFTLVELIISLSLSLIFMSVALFTLNHNFRVWEKYAARFEKRQVSLIAAEKITREVRNALKILPASTSQEVFLSLPGNNISYCLANRKIRRKLSASTSYLTDDNAVRSLSFAYPDPHSVLIKMEEMKYYASTRN